MMLSLPSSLSSVMTSSSLPSNLAEMEKDNLQRWLGAVGQPRALFVGT